MAKKTLIILTLVVGLLLPAAVFADTAAWEWTTTGIDFTNGNWTFGQVFTVGSQNITVDFLGYFNDGTMADSHPVSIWDANGGPNRLLHYHQGFRVHDRPLPVQHDLPGHPACGADL